MRRASSSLLSAITESNLSSRNLLANLFSHLSPRRQSLLSPPHLNPTSNSYPLLPNPHPFSKFPPHRANQTLSLISTPLPNRHSELGASRLREALESATTSEELLAAFKNMESSLDESDERLGAACLMVGERLESPGFEEADKALDFALRALKIFEKRDGGWSLSIVKALRLMGSIACKLERFDDSLESLNAADEILERLQFGSCSDSEVWLVSIAVQLQLASTKTAMGRRREALLNLRKSLELKKSILEHSSLELGTAYKHLAEACTVVLDFKEALPLCWKALEIYEAQFGVDSAEVVQVRQLLGIIYTSLGKNEEALKQNELSRRVLESSGLDTELLEVEINVANIQIALGRVDEAMNTLKRAIQRSEKESETRAFVFVSMAKALCCQEKFGDSRRCLEIACGILDTKDSASPAKVAEAYADIAMLYETMNEFETALSLMKRTLAMLEKLPQEQHLEGSIMARMGWLLLVTKRVPQAVPYLESAIEKLKNCFGPKHFGLGFVYKHLGQAYLEMDQPQSAVKMLALAKDIIDFSFGPYHEDSIDTCQCLANAYGAMGSFSLAMEFQQQVADAWENHGPGARDELREAHRLLEQLKKKAQGSPSAVFPANTLPLPPQK
ncbi:protein KINESIN LIGHT CHAIN-RELATED 2-like [Phoenix dactylifera]|uniref:Protein KINESIN LIGHT CHAIN-RELATED 2-like n=1 Tax=Phoenix dactylifera TaxID=42345 RepID=A0A8B7BSY4_PHODC|nr:protein KINESIN LIGHT CHAIN-RELATED 2-like [Phoenix dactylifera]